MAAASAAVNTFQTVTQTVSTSEAVVYTAPVGYTGVVLLAQCTNMGSTTYTMTFQFRRDGTDVPLISEVPIPPNDTVNLLAGKLVLETGDSLVTNGSNATNLKFLTSILETSNL
tara:strand:+ start:905 stop:1246 length:342 start_codon:yes stop_codon:yes gene_type:complete